MTERQQTPVEEEAQDTVTLWGPLVALGTLTGQAMLVPTSGSLRMGCGQ